MALTPEQQAMQDAWREQQSHGGSSSAPSGLTPEQQAMQDAWINAQPSTLERIGNYTNEALGAAGQSIASGLDIVTSPVQAAVGAVTQGKLVEPNFFQSLVPPAGAYAGKGTATNVIRGIAGAIPDAMMAGGALRAGAGLLSPLATQGESAARGMLRQAGQTTAAADIGYGGLSGGAGAIGKDTGGTPGELAAGILAPGIAGLATGGLKALMASGPSISMLTKNLASLSDKAAGELLADAMVRSNMSPDDVAQRIESLGPDAIPADVSDGFRRLLRLAVNKVPAMQGRAIGGKQSILNVRQAGQADRLASGLDVATGTPGLNVDDEIKRLQISTKPLIDEAYRKVGNMPVSLSGRLRNLLQGDTSLGKAYQQAQVKLADKRALGDQISNYDVIQATKEVLGDQIGTALRAGENNKARDLMRFKNEMMSEADAALPGYKDARNLFAGQRNLENAADIGGNFINMTQREIDDAVKTMGASELRMMRLGAKQAYLDKLDTLPIGGDSVSRLFGKNGSSEKLRSLFPTKKGFDEFNKVMTNEAEYTTTRRAAGGNSTTAQQLEDVKAFENAQGVTDNLSTNPMKMFADFMVGKASAKKSAVYQEGLTKAGDILLQNGIDPQRVKNILRGGYSPVLQKMLEDNLFRPGVMSQEQGRAIQSAFPAQAGIISQQQ